MNSGIAYMSLNGELNTPLILYSISIFVRFVGR